MTVEKKKRFNIISASMEVPGKGEMEKLMENLGKSPMAPLQQYESGTKLEDIPAIQVEDEVEAIGILNWNYDVKIQEVQEKMILNTSHNRQWCFDNDNVTQLVAYSITRLMIGNGLKYRSENKDIEDTLTRWSKNVRKTPSVYSIKALIRDTIIDNLNHGEALFSKKIVKVDNMEKMILDQKKEKEEKDKDPIETVAVFRIDQRTIRTIEHDFLGLKKWLQYALVPAELISQDSKTATESAEFFYSENYRPGGIGPVDTYARTPRAYAHITQITDRDAIHFNLFTSPPIKPVMPEIVYKKWITWAMRVAAERNAIPERWAQIGTPEDHPPDEEYEDVLRDAMEHLQASRGGDVHAVPYNWNLQFADPTKSNFNFVGEVQHLNEQIVLGLGSHMALYQASGSDLATSSVIEDMLIRSVIGMRDEIALVLEDLLTQVLKVEGFDIADEKNKYEILWSPIKADAFADFVNTITTLSQTEIGGKPILKNRKEARKLLEGFLNLPPLKEDEADEDAATDTSDTDDKGLPFKTVDVSKQPIPPQASTQNTDGDDADEVSSDQQTEEKKKKKPKKKKKK